jgi:hypothetical protein
MSGFLSLAMEYPRKIYKTILQCLQKWGDGLVIKSVNISMLFQIFMWQEILAPSCTLGSVMKILGIRGKFQSYSPGLESKLRGRGRHLHIYHLRLVWEMEMY